jgi:uncharacterized protein
MPNNFCWYELMTPDVDAAKSFYGRVIGWMADAMGGDNSYTILSTEGRGVAGILEKSAGLDGQAQSAWLGYIEVEDCEEAARRIEAAGGTIHRQPADIPGVGRFAVVADPQGAIFYIMSLLPQEAPPPLPKYAPGTAGWRELNAEDWAAAFDFYSTQFGWTKDEAMDMGPMGTYQLFAAGGEAIGGMMTKPECAARPFWLYYFCVEDIDAAMARVTESGGELLHGPSEVPGGVYIIQAKDPQGGMFALVGPRVEVGGE